MTPVFAAKSVTAAANTAFNVLVPAIPNMIPRITNIIYTSSSTAHTLTVMRTSASTTAAARAASGQKVVEFTDIGAMNTVDDDSDEIVAANDFIVFQDEFGRQHVDFVASVSGNNVTMTVNLPGNVDAGAPIWILGELARASVLTFTPPVSATTGLGMMCQGGIPGQANTQSRTGAGDPIVVYSNNATAAGILVTVTGYYADSGDVTML